MRPIHPFNIHLDVIYSFNTSKGYQIISDNSRSPVHSRSDPRSDGSSSGECEVPLVFANAVHIAVDCDAGDVLRLLLRYGVPPDRPGQ